MSEPKCSTLDFVKVWQAAQSLREVAERSGYRVSAARNKAARLRKLGVRLKMMPSHRAPDYTVEELNAAIEAPQRVPPKRPAAPRPRRIMEGDVSISRRRR